jgi:homoserine kinase
MRVVARVPATVANLGAGFDCLALAVDLCNEFQLDTEGEPGVFVEGEDATDLPADATNLVFRTISFLAGEVGGVLAPFRLLCTNRIPLQRGLGSSASAVVGGLLLADRLLGTKLSADDLLGLAVDLEGHPDNVAACLRGGLAVVYLSAGGWRAETLSPHPSLRPALVVPLSERLATEDARRVLPRTVPLADAGFNLSRSVLAVLALTERPHLLFDAIQDRLHQPYRLPLVPATRALFQDLKDQGFPVCVAGSGPALLAFEDEDRAVPDLGPGWRVLRPAIDLAGARVTEG